MSAIIKVVVTREDGTEQVFEGNGHCSVVVTSASRRLPPASDVSWLDLHMALNPPAPQEPQ